MREHHSLLPRFDEWGIFPEGHRGPRNNPWAAQPEQMGELPEPDKAEDSGEGEASGGADPSGGFASSSRSAPPEGDLQVILSSSDEEASHGTPPNAPRRRRRRAAAGEDVTIPAPSPPMTGTPWPRGALLARRQGRLEKEPGQAAPAAKGEEEGVEDG